MPTALATETATVKTCANCHTATARLIKQLCAKCYKYQARHGGARPVPEVTTTDTPAPAPTPTPVKGPVCFACEQAPAEAVYNGRCGACFQVYQDSLQPLPGSTPKAVPAPAPAARPAADHPYAEALQAIVAIVEGGHESIIAALKDGRLRFRTLTVKSAGTAPRRGKLDIDKARDIRTRLAAGEKADVLAAEYGVHVSTIQDIKAGRVWKEVA